MSDSEKLQQVEEALFRCHLGFKRRENGNILHVNLRADIEKITGIFFDRDKTADFCERLDRAVQSSS